MPAKVVLLFAALLTASQVHAAVALEVLRPTGENLLKDGDWQPHGQGFTREGETFVCDNGPDAKVQRGANQAVVLAQKVPAPIIATAWSKAENVGGATDSDYSIYLDLTYADGTPLWGQVGVFRTGSHDWQKAEVTVFPTKPVKQVNVYLLLRRHTGKAYFKGPQLSTVTAPEGAALFDGVPVRVKSFEGKDQWLVRDVAAGSDFVTFESGNEGRQEALGLCLAVGHGTGLQAKLTDTLGRDRAITLVYVFPVAGNGWRWLVGPREERPAVAPLEYVNTVRAGNVGANGQLSRYPFAAISDGKKGHAMGCDLAQPAFFRTGYSAGTGLLYVAYDIALTPEKPSVELHAVQWSFDGSQGFRGAVAKMYETFPDQFRCRTPQQGLWMPFHAISKVQGWEDFGFKFKEGNDETAWDDAHHILTFRYTEPMTWWMPMPKGMPRTYEAALVDVKRQVEKGDIYAKALLVSGHHDAAGRFPVRFPNEPWCDGAVWSMNSSPGIAGDVTDFKNKWNPALKEKLYGPGRKGDLDGEYVDSTEGYVTDVLDFRREHFAGQRTPLVFATDTKAPAVFRGLIAYEYAAAIADDVHAMGKLMMCNGVPHACPWLAPVFDVLGTETDWNPGGQWRPMSDEELMVRRVMCGPKPYCFLMNTDFDKFSHELVEKYMKRCLAYGMFPGFFSPNASQGHYFSRPELYNRDRPLFKKYVPLVKRVAEAGWQPVTKARTDNPRVYVERFGSRYLTVFNDSREERRATLTLDGPAPAKARELIRGADVVWTNSQTVLTLGPEDVAVIDLE